MNADVTSAVQARSSLSRFPPNSFSEPYLPTSVDREHGLLKGIIWLSGLVSRYEHAFQCRIPEFCPQ